MILAFKQQFPDGRLTHFRRKIERGIKIHSIREDWHDRWHAGRIIQMSNGVRTKNYHCFRKELCSGVQIISIRWLYSPLSLREKCCVSIDGSILSLIEIMQLSYNDGFDDVSDFFNWFNNDFDSKIIHWTLYRYR
jgi:hypothetical protein